jgi:hypothetical protein
MCNQEINFTNLPDAVAALQGLESQEAASFGRLPASGGDVDSLRTSFEKVTAPKNVVMTSSGKPPAKGSNYGDFAWPGCD